jgi:predicted transcriptional regulator
MDTENTEQVPAEEILRMTAEVVSAYLSNNLLPASQISEVIQTVHTSLNSLGAGRTDSAVEPPKPAVPVKKSVTADYIICLEDGKKLKMLKRHLMTHYQMTPDQYRQKWGLAADYPMVAPNYAEQRRKLAKAIGLGTKRRKTRSR